MDKIEELLRRAAQEQQNKQPPFTFSNTIKHSLENKKVRRFYIPKFATVMAVMILTCIISVSAYAALSGKIGPMIEFLGIKFSNEYENYVVEDNQTVSQDGTSISLVSKVCDDGFIILEFDVHLSEADKEYLHIGEIELYEEITVDESGKNRLKKEERMMDVEILFNNKIVEVDGQRQLSGLNNFNLIIDGENYWLRPRGAQTISRISDNEYKVFQMYFLTEKELKNKKEFEITLKDIVLTPSHGEIKFIPIKGEFNIILSKEKAVENTAVFSIESNAKSTYKKMTTEITKLRVTPLQIIAEVTTTIQDVSLQSLSHETHKDHIGIKEYRVKDQYGKELLNCPYEVKRTMKYIDGRQEEWECGDIGTSNNFEHAQMILKEYIIIEKENDVDTIVITPTIRTREEIIELEDITIDMKLLGQ